MDAEQPVVQVELRFWGGRRGLNPAEAVILKELLMLEPNSAARNLALRIGAASITGDQVTVDSYELKTLSALMSATDAGPNPGLLKLKETCATLAFMVSDGTSRNA